MTHHTMILSEQHPIHTACYYKYYATIDVSMQGSSWSWIQVDIHGQLYGNARSPFTSEFDALSDALSTLNGIGWE